MNRVLYGMKVRTWLASVMALAVAGSLGFAALPAKNIPGNTPAARQADKATPDQVAKGTSYAKTLSMAFRGAAERTLPAVVMIRTTPNVTRMKGSSDSESSPGDMSPNSPFGDLFRNNPDLRKFFKEFPSHPHRDAGGLGSGVIIDPSGIVLTNNHVVDGGKVSVRLHDGREFQVAEVKKDPRSDLAVLRLKGASNLPAARLGDSDSLEVGDWVLALGQPFGLEGTVTAGIISAKGRGIGINPRESFLQTDASINPGNSGGPLVNLDGEVVGINTAISSSNGANQGVGFAVPVNLAKWVADQLVKNGKVSRSYLGVVIQPVSQELANKFGVKPNGGVVVAEVRSNSPADKAGLKPGDVITQFNGKPVTATTQLQGMVEEIPSGTTEPMTVIRDGKTMNVNVTYQAQPKNYGLAQSESEGSGNEGATRMSKLGLEVENLSPQIAEKLGMKGAHGVVVTGVESGSVAGMAGLTTGMVITEVNRKPVKNADDFRAAVTDQGLANGLLLLVRTEQGSRFVILKVE